MAMLNKDTRKQDWIKAIFNDYPDLKTDTLKHHYIENMIDAYLADERTFKKKTYELKSKGDEPKPTKVPDEIVCIGKVEAEEQTPTIVEEVEADN